MAIDTNGTSIQMAYGGYILQNPETVVKENLVYSEPGFTTTSTIEFAIPKADQFYFIIRQRQDVFGTEFKYISSSNFLVTVTDATLDVRIDADLDDFSSTSDFYDSSWEDGLDDGQKMILSVNSGIPLESPSNRIRILDCKIKDTTDDSLLLFRVLVDDSNKIFSYLTVKSNEVNQRNRNSTSGSNFILQIDGKGDSYVLVSPFSSFNEVDKGQHSFEYPANTIFYNRQNSYNKENFSYQIYQYSNSSLVNGIRVKNVPGYPQMGVIIIDKGLYEDMVAGSLVGGYVDVEVRGLISEMRDVFRINFSRV